MILKRTFYNNGYACSCCRRDWEETEWIDEKEMLSTEQLDAVIEHSLDNVTDDCLVAGIVYEKDGVELYGFKLDIYRASTEVRLCMDSVWKKLSEEQYRDWETDRKSTRLNSSHRSLSRMPSSA